MTRSELILKLAEKNPHLYQRDAEQIVATIFDEITEALANGDRVELRGFGAFSVKHRKARVGRNPRTGEKVFVEEKFVPFFKTGKKLHERLNDNNASAAEESPAQPSAAPVSPSPYGGEDHSAPSSTPENTSDSGFGGQDDGGDDDNSGGFSGF